MKKILLANLILPLFLLCGCSFLNNDTSTYIGEEAALDIVMQEYALSKDSMTDINVELDSDIIGRDEYFITFNLRGHTYEYEIDARTGKVSSISVS